MRVFREKERELGNAKLRWYGASLADVKTASKTLFWLSNWNLLREAAHTAEGCTSRHSGSRFLARAICKGNTSHIEHSIQSTTPKGSTLLLLLCIGSTRSLTHMENTSHTSFISPAAATSIAGESSWAMHFADLASSYNRQEMNHPGVPSGSSFSSGFSSSFASFGDDASFITSELMCDDNEDDSLQDTACSSAAGSKVASMNDIDMKSMVTMDAKEINTPHQLAKYFVDVGSRQQVTDAVRQEVISGENNNEKALYECNDLRKKGLCLVPLSMLIDYLG